jgi:hypothetical protein
MSLRRNAPASLLLGLSACSWAGMVRAPPTPVEPTPPVTCTTSRAAPALDTVGAVLLAIPGILGLGYGLQPVCNDGWCMFQPESNGARAAGIGVGLAFLGLAAMETVSAVQGYVWASDCESMKENQLACVSGVEASCAVLRSPPPRPGKSPGEPCTVDDGCSQGNVCYLGRCQRGGP